jgi:hypothetical protein
MTAIFENPCISLSKENEKFFLQGLKSKNQKKMKKGLAKLGIKYNSETIKEIDKKIFKDFI